MEKLVFGIGAAIFMALSAAACGGSVTGGSGGGGGEGGAGGSAQSLADQGTIKPDCAPNDGPAIAIRIGWPSACDATAESTPFARFYAYPVMMKDLTEGQSWTVSTGIGSQGVNATWFPNGSNGEQVVVESGSIEVISVSDPEVGVRYQFVTPSGESYSGEATVSTCPAAAPMCG